MDVSPVLVLPFAASREGGAVGRVQDVVLRLR